MSKIEVATTTSFRRPVMNYTYTYTLDTKSALNFDSAINSMAINSTAFIFDKSLHF